MKTQAKWMMTAAVPTGEKVILNAWNEYTEGCWLVPDENIGAASLQAIRTVFRRK